MSELEKSLEDQISEAGFEIETQSVSEMSQEQVEPTPTGGVPDFLKDQAPALDLSTPAEPETPAEPATAAETTPPVETPAVEPESSLQTETPATTAELTEEAVTSFLSDKLGLQLENLEQLTAAMSTENKAEIDERVKAIQDFVSETGRSPEDWFKYQSLNPTEMDDLTAVKMQFTSEYPDLSNEEIELFVENKYKLDEDLYTEEEIRLSKLQLKIDAGTARKSIDALRDSFKAPEAKAEPAVTNPFNEEWTKAMTNETNALEALTFDLPDGEFNFRISNEYRSELLGKNSKMERFFDQYVDASGKWNFDKLNTHRALIDNIDAIAKSIYQQGLANGQRKIVEQAANVQQNTPQVGGNSTGSDLEQQVMDALGLDSTLKFRI